MYKNTKTPKGRQIWTLAAKWRSIKTTDCMWSSVCETVGHLYVCLFVPSFTCLMPLWWVCCWALCRQEGRWGRHCVSLLCPGWWNAWLPRPSTLRWRLRRAGSTARKSLGPASCLVCVTRPGSCSFCSRIRSVGGIISSLVWLGWLGDWPD